MREKAAEGRGLYRPEFEHDACGIGAVVDIQGRASHETVDDALKIVEKLEHRAGKDAEGKTGDGVGILTQIPHAFFARAAAAAITARTSSEIWIFPSSSDRETYSLPSLTVVTLLF